MDFVNAVYISLLSTDTVKLQYIPNAAARLIGALPKCSHISGIIRDSLLWFPIMHIHIYIPKHVLMCNCLIGVTPTFLTAFCILVSSRILVVVLHMCSAKSQSRSFVYVFPHLGSVFHSGVASVEWASPQNCCATLLKAQCIMCTYVYIFVP